MVHDLFPGGQSFSAALALLLTSAIALGGISAALTAALRSVVNFHSERMVRAVSFGMAFVVAIVAYILGVFRGYFPYSDNDLWNVLNVAFAAAGGKQAFYLVWDATIGRAKEQAAVSSTNTVVLPPAPTVPPSQLVISEGEPAHSGPIFLTQKQVEDAGKE